MNFHLMLLATKQRDYATAKIFSTEMQRLTAQNSEYGKLIAAEIESFRQKYPQYDWPIPRDF